MAIAFMLPANSMVAKRAELSPLAFVSIFELFIYRVQLSDDFFCQHIEENGLIYPMKAI